MARTARRPVTDFAVAAQKILSEARREGLDFDAAWQRVISTIRPSDTGWGPLDRTGIGLAEGDYETPLQHCWRVMRDAYGTGNGCPS
jgi:hypothetical protein